MRADLYFAYGSNLHPLRLQERTPSAVLHGVAELDSHALRFHKRGADGSGKCNAFATGRADDRVFGVLYRIDAADVARLDHFEGRGSGYDRCNVEVRQGRSPVPAFTYLAQPDHIDDSLAPFDWYRQLVARGALRHGFPAPYVAAIEAIATIPDPDALRAAEILALLQRMG